MEIILSDDASLDRTFEIMTALAQAYVGPHSVIVNRNEQNLGLIRHVEHAVGLSSGALLVAMAGDDVSAPDRASKLLAAWQAHRERTAILHSKLAAMDSSGTPTPTPPDIAMKYEVIGRPLEHVIAKTSAINGATAAWTRDLFERFGPLVERNALEDTVLAFRALLLGGEIIFLADPLVQYRVAVSTWIRPASSAMQHDQIMHRISRFAECQLGSLRQMRMDLSLHPDEKLLSDLIGRQYTYHHSIYQLALKPGITSVLKFYFRSWRELNLRIIASSLRFVFPRVYAVYWNRRFKGN